MSESNNDARLRPHPDDRFAPDQIMLDLSAVSERLRAEHSAGGRGHRQETLYHHGNLTIALFLFAQGGTMAAHRTKGVVSIHILRGRMTITAAGQTHDMPAGRMLILSPEVVHDLRAEEESEMLLTVRL